MSGTYILFDPSLFEVREIIFFIFAALAIPNEKMDVLPPVNPQILKMDDQSLRDADPAPSSQVTAGAGEQTNKAKTLKDAVKPKHKRKKKNLSNTDGS